MPTFKNDPVESSTVTGVDLIGSFAKGR